MRSGLVASRAASRRLSEQIDLLEMVGNLVRTLIDAELLEGVKALGSLQTEGVKAVFQDQELEVKTEVEVLRGKVSVSLVTSQRKANGDLIEGATLEGFGGAVSTVQSILLRLALIFRRGLRPILVLDETLPAFDHGYVHNMAKFLQNMCHKLNVDILLITHNTALVESADIAYVVQEGKGFTTFKRIR